MLIITVITAIRTIKDYHMKLVLVWLRILHSQTNHNFIQLMEAIIYLKNNNKIKI
jgi:hypothetical protein